MKQKLSKKDGNNNFPQGRPFLKSPANKRTRIAGYYCLHSRQGFQQFCRECDKTISYENKMDKFN